MMMAYPTKKTKFGPKIQRWQEEMNREFNRTLLPTPLIHVQETKTVESRIVSDGQIRLEKIKVKVQQGHLVKFLDIYVQRFISIGTNYHCKWPECTKSREATNNARDSLYLCEFHRKRMEKYLTKMCADNQVVINARYSPGDFEGYDALIELFESALRRTSAVYEGEEGKLLQDLFLNVRNVLIIVSATIRPDEDVLSSFLSHIMGIVLEIVKTRYQHPIANLVSFMEQFIEYILFFFGIMSPWDPHSLYPRGRPYRQIGMGVGGMVGVFGLFVVSVPHALVAISAGVLGGAAAGNRWYINKRRREMLDASYCRYLTFRCMHQEYQLGDDTPDNLNFLSGSAYGDTLLFVVLIVQALVILMAL